MEIAGLPLALVSTAAALIAVGAAVFSGRAWPVGVRARLVQVERIASDAQVRAEELASTWEKHRIQNAEHLEAIDDVLEQIEKKRRRIAAAESRERASSRNGAPDPSELSHDDLRALARAQGFKV